MDSHFRSIVKSLSWRVFAAVITSLVVWGITGQGRLGFLVGISDTTIKLGVYYAHERAWNRINFGRAKAPDDEI